MEHITLWGQFAVAAALIVFAGVKLTTYGDILSERLKLGHAFVGAVLIGWSTSLPELVLSIGTSAYEGAPDITMGNVLGSNLFNLFIIVLLDLYFIKGAILREVKGSVKLSAILSFFIVLSVGIFLCLPSFSKGVVAGPLEIGYNAIVIFSIYMFCMVVLYIKDKPEGGEGEEKYKDESLAAVLGKCVAIVALVVVSGLWLSTLSTKLQTAYSLNGSFVGSFFLAIVSSLPEVITCFVAVRMGFHSMAIGTLFGSNIFNMGIISFCYIFYTGTEKLPPHIFRSVQGHEHLSSVALVLLMTVVTIICLRPKPEGKKTGFIGPESVVIALMYAGALYLSYYQPNFMTPIWSKLIQMFG